MMVKEVEFSFRYGRSWNLLVGTVLLKIIS